MLATYSGVSFGQSVQAEHSYPPEHGLQPHQIVYEGYPRVLRSTSENIRTPNHLNHGPSAFSKPRPPRPGPQIVKTIRLRDRLDLNDEKDLCYEAIAIKKVKSKKERGASRTSSKDVKETRQLYKKIPAAASADDCKPEAAYYKYRSSAKQERCKKDWCKEHDSHVMWPDDVERSFQFWIRTILPMGKKKVTAEVFKYEKEEDADINCKPPAICRKQCGRNELISMMIYLDTGQVRDRKRISSHIQVLRGHTKRDNDEIFTEEDGSSASHDECAVLYEKWGKLRWNPDTKRIEPDRKHATSDLRSNYQLSSRNSRYQSSHLPHSYSDFHGNGPPRFKEMHFCLYVTLKNAANDNPLHTYTIAQQRTGAKAWNIHNIPNLQSFFPPTRHLSDDQHQDQLFYCEASLRMRHDLTEKGYQVGPEMQVMLTCPPDYHHWRVRATGYSGEGTQLIKSEERICDWAQDSDGQIQIVLWASAVYWAQLLSDCKVAYEGKQRSGSEYLPDDLDLLATADPSSRCNRILERSSFVQEIFATRSTGEEVRVALLLWRFRQATENESTGLWTWRKIERYPEALQIGPEIIGPYQELPRSASMMSMQPGFVKHDENDVESFDFNDLSMPIPDSRQSKSALGSPRHSTAFDWNSFDEGANPSQSETSSFDDRLGTEQPQPSPAFLDTEMDVDSSTQSSPFSSKPSSAHTTQTPVDNSFTTQEAPFPLEFEHNMDLPTDWASLDFSVIPGLETPGRLTERQNMSSARQNNRISLATPLALRQDASFPIDPALSTWATPASQGQTVEHEGQDTPIAHSRHAIARALTYLPPVPQTHILKSSKEEPSSSPDRSTTPTPHRYQQQDGRQSPEVFETPSRLPVRDHPHSPLEPYRPASTAQMDEAQDPTGQASPHEDTDESNDASFATQSFHSVQSTHEVQFNDHDSSFVIAVSTSGTSALESFDDQNSSLQTQVANDQYNHTFNSQASEAIEENWHEITQHPQHPQHHHHTTHHTTFNHAHPHSRLQPPPRTYPHRENSSIPASDDFEELCGDAAQLAHLSSFEVCDDGANLAHLAQIHSATLRDSFSQSQQTTSTSSFHSALSSYPNPNFRHHNAQVHAQNGHQAHPTLYSQHSRSRYPSLSGLEALITAAVGVGAGVEDGPLSAPAFGATGPSSFHSQPDRGPLSASASVPVSGPSSPRASHEEHAQDNGSRVLGHLSSWNMDMIRQFGGNGDGMARGRQTGMAGPRTMAGSYGADDEDGDAGVGAVLGEVGEDFEL